MKIDITLPERIAERDVDLLMLEELHCNPSFAVWLFKRVTGRTDYGLVAAAHSVLGKGGESDIVATYQENGGPTVHAVMIENKIAAEMQHQQATRYRLRGRRGMDDGNWNTFCTVLIAPLRYILSKGNHGYDHAVSYEDIATQISNEDDVRSQWKAAILLKATAANSVVKTRSMRLPFDLDDALVSASKQEGRSVNALVEGILLEAMKESGDFVAEEQGE